MAHTLAKSLSQFSLLRFISSGHNSPHMFLAYASARRQLSTAGEAREEGDEEVPTEGISRPLSVILRQLNKKVPESVIRVRHQDGFPVKYIPWHIVNRILNLHVPEWSGEVRSITYSPDGKTVSVVYRVTLHGTDAEKLIANQSGAQSGIHRTWE